jgi:hypothetical protein
MRPSLLLTLLALVVGCPSANDDDATANDDDATANDDDATTDDDDATTDDDDATTDDDDATTDDDDATTDDDDSAGDDDDATTDDDDATLPDDDDSAGDDDDSAAGPCDDWTGGAQITIQTGPDTFTFWSTDSPFIDDCIAAVGTQGWYVLLSTPITPSGCDAQWSWTVDPPQGSLNNTPPFNPACIGSASQVESNLAQYQAASAGWCPFAGIVSVSDQR